MRGCLGEVSVLTALVVNTFAAGQAPVEPTPIEQPATEEVPTEKVAAEPAPVEGVPGEQVKVERRAIEWLPGAEFTFVETPPQFVVKLKWRREIRIDLEKLQITGSEADGGPAGGESHQAIPPEILALLETPASAPAGQTDLSHGDSANGAREALEALRDRFGEDIVRQGSDLLDEDS